VAEVYLRHTRPWFVGLACFGSAVRGGIIPGASDIDFHLFLELEAFTPDGVLPLELALAIHRDLARVDPAPFRYIDGGAETGVLPEGHVGPVPGTYHVIAGRMPLAEATAEQLRAQARWSLARLNPVPAFVPEGLLHHGAGRGQLAVTVRQYTQLVWPVLYQVLCLQAEGPITVWQLPKHRAVALMPPGTAMGKAIRAFDAAVRRYYPTEEGVEEALAVIEAWAGFLRMVAAWFGARNQMNEILDNRRY
jgi:hypothetical protein